MLSVYCGMNDAKFWPEIANSILEMACLLQCEQTIIPHGAENSSFGTMMVILIIPLYIYIYIY